MSNNLSLTGSERSGGIFGDRKFNMASAFPSSNKTPKEPQTTETIQKSPRNRTQRAVPDHGLSKFEVIERTRKSIDLAPSRYAAEKIGASRNAFDVGSLLNSNK